MVTVDNIKWGKYKKFEGPYFKGNIKYVAPQNPTESQRRLAVGCQTEGAAYDAVNMYDSCIVSVGLIQWCETHYLTSRLLGHICENVSEDVVIDALAPALDITGSVFKKNKAGQWRFFFLDKRDEVNSLGKQQELFLGTTVKDGKIMPNDGTSECWNDGNRSIALLWASCFANVWLNKDARDVQASFTAQRLTGFLMPNAKKTLWDGTDDASWRGMFRAAFLSYAGNNPKIADEQLSLFCSQTKHVKWSSDWCIGALKQLTFGPNIAIYPARYTKIRPVLETHWEGVRLPTLNDLMLIT